MNSMTTIYNGNSVFAPFNAGLYGIDDGGSDRMLLLDDSKAEILRAFKNEFETKIIGALAVAGIHYRGLEWWSPREYNFATDSIDLKVEFDDIEEGAYRHQCELRKEKIQKLLDDNKSYDGYMALTPDTYEEAVEQGSIAVIMALLSDIDFSEFDIYEHLMYEYPCEVCERIHGHDAEYGDDEQKAELQKCPKYQEESTMGI